MRHGRHLAEHAGLPLLLQGRARLQHLPRAEERRGKGRSDVFRFLERMVTRTVAADRGGPADGCPDNDESCLARRHTPPSDRLVWIRRRCASRFRAKWTPVASKKRVKQKDPFVQPASVREFFVIPSTSIRDASVVGLMSSISAAPPGPKTLPPQACRAARILARS